MKKQRVAILLNFIPPYLVTFFETLNKNITNLRIFISTTMEPNRPWKFGQYEFDLVKQKNLTVRRIWKHPHGFADQLFIQIPYDTFFQLAKFKPDTIISGELGIRTIFSLIYKFFYRKVKVIIWMRVSEHTEKGRGVIRSLVRKLFLRYADAVVVNGKSGKRYIQRFGVKEEKVHIVNLAVEKSLFYTVPGQKEENRPLRFLYVGQLIPRKGILEFCLNLSRVLQDNPEYVCEFWLVGDGSQRLEIEKMPLPQNLMLRFFGNLEYSQLPQVYRQCDLLVFPTLADEWGYVVNEALMSGLPVLGSIYSQAVEELIVENFNGWLIDPLDSKLVVKQISEVFSTTLDNLEKMRQNATRGVKNLTIEENVQKFLAVLSSIT